MLSEYEPLSKKQVEKLWDEGIVILDANVLLNLYRFQHSTTEQYISILKKFSQEDRLWCPYQAMEEFLRNKDHVISHVEKSYNEITNSLEKVVNKEIERQKNKNINHPLIDFNTDYKEVKNSIENFQSKIKEKAEKQKKRSERDDVLNEIRAIYRDKIGPRPSVNELINIYKEGKTRYKLRIPPGYEDEKAKSDYKRYGDLVLWKQILAKASEDGVSIILVTSEKKEDWWEKRDNGKKTGPRITLKQEFSDHAKKLFHMYSAEEFLKHAAKYQKVKIDDEAIKEVETIQNRYGTAHDNPHSLIQVQRRNYTDQIQHLKSRTRRMESTAIDSESKYASSVYEILEKQDIILSEALEAATFIRIRRMDSILSLAYKMDFLLTSLINTPKITSNHIRELKNTQKRLIMTLTQ